MLQRSAELSSVLELAPEWESLLRNWQPQRPDAATYEFLSKVGPKALYCKALAAKNERSQFLRLLQVDYFQPMLAKMLASNQNLRRFLAQRRVAVDEQRALAISQSSELAQKLVANLTKQLDAQAEDGFKALLPAYAQRSVHNAVIDYIRLESNWERQTLQDVYLDPQQEDPRTNVADDEAYTPETQILSGERVSQLNQFREQLKSMLADSSVPKEPLTVVDCMFGLGLTPHSVPGEELTMRETCEKLRIEGDTMPRRIARCQVFLDKGLDLVRQKLYKDAPSIAESWQRGININTASRRELSQHLGLTEGEVERLIKGRQFTSLDETVRREVVKPQRLGELKHKGAVAAFVPVDVNSATARDMTDILGMPKELAQRVVGERPFKDLQELVGKKLLEPSRLPELTKKGAVVRAKFADSKRLDLNRLPEDEMLQAGVDGNTAKILTRTRPFTTWAEVEEFMGPDCPSWTVLRQKFFLGLAPG